MSNVEKGNKFEEQSIKIIHEAIESGDFGVHKDYVKVFQKKGYYSELRKGDIQFDISVEVWPPNAENFTLLYIIECKSYGHRIPVDEVETFHSQLTQLNLMNIKGVFVTDAPFQKGGNEMVKSLGMMHIQADTNGLYDIVLYKQNKREGKRVIPIIEATKTQSPINEDLSTRIDETILSAFSKHVEDYKVSYGIHKLFESDIRLKAEEVLNELNPEVLEKGKLLEYDELKRFIQEQLEIKVTELRSKDANIIGRCDFHERKISIHASLKEKKRRLFVLAHELGHFILHSKLRIGQHEYDLCDDSKDGFRIRKVNLRSPKDWIEWQANCFAEHLVINDQPFMYHLNKSIKRVYGIKEIHSKLILKDEEAVRKKIDEIVENLSWSFEVSKTSVYIKLRKINMIEDQSHLRVLGDIIAENQELFYI